MLSSKDIYLIQSAKNFNDEEAGDAISFKSYVTECREFLNTNLSDDYNSADMTLEKKEAERTRLINLFVEKHQVKVEGYILNGVMNIEFLRADLHDSVNGVGILKTALMDEDIDEIQVNDFKTLFVIRKGVTEFYEDANGKPYQFTCDEDIAILFRRMVDDGTASVPQFTQGMPLLNAKTAKDGFRLNAVHNSVNTRDMTPSYDFPITTLVLRKFKKVKLTMDDLVAGRTCTAKMGRLLRLLSRTKANMFCIGPTGSGKTTLLDIVMHNSELRDSLTRIITIQNPVEIVFFERDEFGRNKWNTEQWQAVAGDVNDNKLPTMRNLINNSLRCTPDIVLLGEVREPAEFTEAYRSMRTDACVRGTYHAAGVTGAVMRFTDDVAIGMGVSSASILPAMCDVLNVIVYQYKFGKDRRICEIGEVTGCTDGDVDVNMLFRFDYSRLLTLKDSEGRTRTMGNFIQENCMTDKLLDLCAKAGISAEELEEFRYEQTISNAEDFNEYGAYEITKKLKETPEYAEINEFVLFLKILSSDEFKSRKEWGGCKV